MAHRGEWVVSTIAAASRRGAFVEDVMPIARTSSWAFFIRHAAWALAGVLMMGSPARGQSRDQGQSGTQATQLPPYAKTGDLSGPRFGLTLLSGGIVDALKDRGIAV